jgi:hypothetical protein
MLEVLSYVNRKGLEAEIIFSVISRFWLGRMSVINDWPRLSQEIIPRNELLRPDRRWRLKEPLAAGSSGSVKSA